MRHDCTECEDIFAIGNEHGSNLIKWNGISAEAQLLGTQKLFNVEEFDPNSHINVAQTDRTGRLFIGTFSEDFCNTPANHSLYRYTIERGIEPIFSGIYGTSGIAIDERANKLYHVDYSNTGDICKLMHLFFVSFLTHFTNLIQKNCRDFALKIYNVQVMVELYLILN